MENRKFSESNTLFITDYCFNILLEAILDKFKRSHEEADKFGVTQIYGFGNYDKNQANLKQELENYAAGFINGKYLYDKSRELQTGKPLLKLNGFYKTILFEYIGYESIYDFVIDKIEDAAEKEKQQSLNQNTIIEENHYYVSYHFGEYKEIVKCQVTALKNWKNVHYKYMYPNKDGSFKTFIYYGTVKKRADLLHVRTKTLMDGKMVDGGDNILYIGYSDPGSSAFILGTFTAFDINNKIIAGKLIHEKCSSEEEMIRKSKSPKIPPYIAQELRNIRIENEAVIPNDSLEISAKSPYSITYEKIPGTYVFTLIQEKENLGNFNFAIDENTYRIHSLTKGVIIIKDHFELIQNGSVIHFSFELAGIAIFTRLEAFIKTYYLNKGEKDIRGVYSGLDIENRLIGGELLVDFLASKSKDIQS